MTELDVHLEQCAACRSVLAQSSFVGEQLRALPTLLPRPDAQTKLLQALATEHARFLQQAPSIAPAPPDFLKPYMHSQASPAHKTDSITAFSTAETGPLPIIRAKRRRSTAIGPIAVIGLAAAFLMVVMVSGLVALLALAGQKVPGAGTTITSIITPSQVAMARYDTTTPYTHIVSAVADNHAIYYTAYGDNTTNWMLERVDINNKTHSNISVPLLASTSTSPLIVLGSSQNWLVWLQFDAPTPLSQKHGIRGVQTLVRTWSVHGLYLGTQQQGIPQNINTPVTLLNGTFNQNTIPSWVHTPVQGIAFTQHAILIAYIDAKGESRLAEYQLDLTHNTLLSTIATASNGHILTSPTATSDGSIIYWSEEWQSSNASDAVMRGNIWSQATLAAVPSYGRWIAHTTITKQLVRGDEMSFHPQVVGDTLFWLSTADMSSGSTTAVTPNATQPTTPAATPGSDTTNPSVVSKADPTIYLTQIDESIRGTLLASSLDGTVIQAPLNTNGLAAAPQGGTRFLLWQDDKGGYEMYDAIARSSVSVDNVPKGAAFLAVNTNTAVWTVTGENTATASNGGNGTGTRTPTITFRMFQWPLTVQTN